ncbi:MULTISPECIES: 2-oxo acid dehydrogenase subunit E2 [unclassified Knoellia]|uniref:2-oxo acid dehydrogenase subunit E2 n=1 Tax=Knoellia altitudinis TaxID=3404795 RepID=UPI003607A10F
MSGRRNSTRNKIAVASWRPSRDGRIYTRMELDVSAVLAYVDRVRSESGERVTITHVVGAALGRALRQVPEVRARIVMGRRLDLDTCDVGFAVDIAGGSDLAPVKVLGVDRLSPLEVARAVTSGAGQLRAGKDVAYRRSSGIVRLVPTWAVRPALGVASLVAGGLGRGVLGQPGFPLGTAFVSNVGSLGLDEAYLAPLPFARTPLYLAIGAIQDKAVVIDGEVVVRPVVVLVATADHRIVDGAHAGQLAGIVRELLLHPDRLDPAGRPDAMGRADS